MIPEVIGYGDIEPEEFESYYDRWPAELSNIPKGVVEDWIYRHWRDFSEYWLSLNPQDWQYELRIFLTEDIYRIDHVGTWVEDLDAEGVEYVGETPRGSTRLARFMKENGTFPVPIIVAENAGNIVHPRSVREPMKEPYQLIEGHCRLACIRGMINSNYEGLKNEHEVWIVKIPSA